MAGIIAGMVIAPRAGLALGPVMLLTAVGGAAGGGLGGYIGGRVAVD